MTHVLRRFERANIFVLLIGGRRGGWYDEPNRISITQQEYRVAYERARADCLTIIPCVRTETLEHVAILKDLPRVDWKPTKFIDDPQHLIDFLPEVGRVLEMKEAAAEGTSRPPNNWIHPFHCFRDLVNVIKIALGSNLDVGRSLLLDLVAEEISEFATDLMGRDDYASWLLQNITRVFGEISRRVTVSFDHICRGDKIDIPIDIIADLCKMVKPLESSPTIQLIALKQAITSQALADIQPGTTQVKASPLQDACRRTLFRFKAIQKSAKENTVNTTFMPEVIGSRSYQSWPLSFLAVSIAISVALTNACALVEAENLISHIRFGTPLQADPCSRIEFLFPFPSIAIAAKDKPTFESWVKSRITKDG